MPAERPIEVALGRRVDDEHTTLGAAGQLGGGLLLGQVEAPRPRRRGDAAPDPVERNTVDVCSLAVEYGRRRPAGARLAQLLVGLAVARHQHGRGLDQHEHVDHVAEPAVLGCEVPGGDHHLRVRRHLSQTSGLARVSVNVAEREQPHAVVLGGDPFPAAARSSLVRASSVSGPRWPGQQVAGSSCASLRMLARAFTVSWLNAWWGTRGSVCSPVVESSR